MTRYLIFNDGVPNSIDDFLKIMLFEEEWGFIESETMEGALRKYTSEVLVKSDDFIRYMTCAVEPFLRQFLWSKRSNSSSPPRGVSNRTFRKNINKYFNYRKELIIPCVKYWKKEIRYDQLPLNMLDYICLNYHFNNCHLSTFNVFESVFEFDLFNEEIKKEILNSNKVLL